MADEPKKELSPDEQVAMVRHLLDPKTIKREAALRAVYQKKTAERDRWLKALFPEGIGRYDKDKVVVRIMQAFPSLTRNEILHMNPGELGPWLEAVADENLEVEQAKPTDPGDCLTSEEKALAALVAHPGWTDTRIASYVGCSRTSLYRWPRYIAAREALESGRQQIPRADQL